MRNETITAVTATMGIILVKIYERALLVVDTAADAAPPLTINGISTADEMSSLEPSM